MKRPIRVRRCAASVGFLVLSAGCLAGCGGGAGGGFSATHTIGGSISGLASSGLVLTDNGADSLMVPSGAMTFTFA